MTTTVPTSTLTPDPTAGNAGPRNITSNNPGLSFFGYGQVDYARPSDAPSDTTETVSRFVVGMNNQFDERTRLVSELEIENTISSADDPGEVEVEQVYIERAFNERIVRQSRVISDSERFAQREPRTHRVLRRVPQPYRNGDHPDDVARRRLAGARQYRDRACDGTLG